MKIDTLSKAQTQKMTPYTREEQKGEKCCMRIQATANRRGKTQSFQNHFDNTLTLTDHMFSA